MRDELRVSCFFNMLKLGESLRVSPDACLWFTGPTPIGPLGVTIDAHCQLLVVTELHLDVM